jgi:hypothetical protein
VSIFAGIVKLDSLQPISQAIVRDLARVISRNPADRPQLFEGPGYAFAKIDLGILGGDGVYVDDAGAVSLLAGAPLLARTAPGSSRHDELRVLHDSWKLGDLSLLQGARGSFCAAHFDPASRRLSLVSDKIGLRPIYYVAQGGFLFFSTALRILESLPGVEKRIDLRGVTEIAALGYSLGSRSPYETVSTLGAGEIVEVLRSGTERLNYWRWDNLSEASLPPDELPLSLFRVFQDAVRRRLGSQRAVVAFLSGGLDSRCIVSCLRLLGAELHTLNFAPAGSQDLVLGKLAADKLGTRHFEFPTGPLDFWDRMLATHTSWLSETAAEREVEHPRLLWSGDGGSCGLGHIYLTEEIVALMRKGRIAEAVEAYLRYNRAGLPRRLFVRGQRERVRGLPHAGILEELSKLRSFDEGRRFHLFLMVNGQRRLLARHYEDLDLRRFELVTPFFDSEFLQVILSSRIDGFLRHRFYTRWLEEYPPDTRATPWQAYLGHVPCPVPVPEGLRGQWEGWYGKEENQALLRQNLDVVEKVLSDSRFPEWLLDRKILRLAVWFTRLGLRDYSYLFKAAHIFTRYSA